MASPKVALLIIGDEVLDGNTQDTNSNFAARLLRQQGFTVSNIMVVGDKPDAITNGLDHCLSVADLVISTGGLGPTKDDLTKLVVSQYFGGELVEDETILLHLKERYGRAGKDLNTLNRAQALVPSVGRAIINPVGTAPVLWIDQGEKVYIALPGVPREMRHLLEIVLLPELKRRFVQGHILQHTLHVTGIPESALALKIAQVDDEIEKATSPELGLKLAYLPTLNHVKLQLTARGDTIPPLQEALDYFTKSIKSLAGEYIYAEGEDLGLGGALGKLLLARKETLSTAESCTAGYLSHLITSYPGSGGFYQGGVIAYANEVKVDVLNVPQEVIDAHGAVSAEVARHMVHGALKKFDTTYALATTGIAGPDGGSELKPVGTIFIGLGSREGVEVFPMLFNRNRLENIHLFATSALELLRRKVLKG